MTRDKIRHTLVLLLAGVLVAATVAWLITSTEWVDEEVALPARGEAAKNPLYAVQALARGLGARVVRREGLTELPPPQATLVLTSSHWDLFPPHTRRLHDWVRSGGQLVIPNSAMDLPGLQGLIAIDDDEVKRKPGTEQCHNLSESDASGTPSPTTYHICAPLVGPAMKAAPNTILWAVQSTDGVEVLRVAVGRGSITVIGPWALLTNSHLLREDNALLTATALQLHRGSDIWFVAEEARTPLLLWLWQNAWPAVLASLLAVVLAVWRSSVRFGSVIKPVGPQRRSMTEQVLGTAEFLHQHGGAVLHAAALRALREAARTRLQKFATQSIFEQARTLAAITGLDEHQLIRALTPPQSKGKQTLSWQLELIETARRRLLNARTTTPDRKPDTNTEPSNPQQDHHANQT